MNVNFMGNTPKTTRTEDVSKNDNLQAAKKAKITDKITESKLERTEKEDNFVKSGDNKKEMPKINPLRIWFNRLTKEQIAEINETGQLPENMKITPKQQGTGYNFIHNIFGITPGTKTVPEGYEFKQNIFGFTMLVPKGTEGLMIKK